jgi:pyruvate-formate lyase-activating enzyme
VKGVVKKQIPQLLVSDTKGKIHNMPYLEATGMKGGLFFRMAPEDLIKMPSGSRLFMLPCRMAVGYDSMAGNFTALDKINFSKRKERYFAVGAFISPGFTATHSASYVEAGAPRVLPLFSYAACAFYRGEFYVSAVRTDREQRHDPRFIDIKAVRRNAIKVKNFFSKNRLIRHLENCALVYACPGAQNFFLGKYEGPLPTSPACNASCMGCISYQTKPECAASQPRIKFVPTPQEVAEIVLFHRKNVRDPILSFGQGCEGEPLLCADIIMRAIKLIRKRTDKGMININTNASRPKILANLFDAGLDSVRVSINSARAKYYHRYYKPKGYRFSDVLKSIGVAKAKNKFVSINYLTIPGFTDSKDEFASLKALVENYRIDMIQWRNLNFDPMRYFRGLKVCVGASEMIGIKNVMNRLIKMFPDLMMGYYNPSRSKIKRRLG